MHSHISEVLFIRMLGFMSPLVHCIRVTLSDYHCCAFLGLVLVYGEPDLRLRVMTCLAPEPWGPWERVRSVVDSACQLRGRHVAAGTGGLDIRRPLGWSLEGQSLDF